MYKRFFGLTDYPFHDHPDPLYFCNTSEATKTFTSLMLGLYERRGLILLTGEAGTGKTALLKTIVDRLDNDLSHAAFIPDPRRNTLPLLDFLLSSFGIEHKAVDNSSKLASLKRWLLKCSARNETVVLVIDDAQTLPPSVLEQVRLLNNVETPEHKLLQIVLAGRPELEAMLQRPELGGLRLRVAHWSHARPLSLEDTNVYLAFRLRAAGGRIKDILTPETVACIYRLSRGIPRLINLLCTRSMISACASGEKPVSARTVQTVAEQLQPDVDTLLDHPLPDPIPIPGERDGSPVAEVLGGKPATGSGPPSAAAPFTPPAEAPGGLPDAPSPAAQAGYGPLPGDAATVSPAEGAAVAIPSTVSEKGTADAVGGRPKFDRTAPAHTPARDAQPVARRRVPVARSANALPPASHTEGTGWPPIKWIVAVVLIVGAGVTAYYVRHETNIRQTTAFRRQGAAPETLLDSRETKAVAAPEPSADAPAATLPEPEKKAEETALPTPPSTPASTRAGPAAPRLSFVAADKLQTAVPKPTAEASGASTSTPVVPKVGAIDVTANVTGAQISLDGHTEPGWVTPHSFAHLPAGTYVVLLAKSGYRSYEQMVEVQAGDTLEVSGTLASQGITVNIQTTPPGADVTIDGKPYGPSPVKTALPPGQHAYDISRAGFEPVTGNLSLDNQESVTKIVELQLATPKAAPSNVQISTTPPGSKVYVDGTPVAGLTPASFRIAPGNHTLIFVLAGYRAARRDINVPAQGTVSLSQTLLPQ